MQQPGFETILAPVDFSDLSGHALRIAARLAACAQGRMIVPYAAWFEAPPYFTESRLQELKDQFSRSLQEAESSLNAFVSSILGDGPVPFETRVVEGLPADAILKLADQVHAGAIVMGTHGRTGYNRWMLGSVAERVLRESPVPVLTTRGPAEAPIRQILCPVNDTEASRKALQVATRLAACFDATVTALHVDEEHGRGAFSNLCSRVPPEQRDRCRIMEQVRQGDAAEEIVAAASKGGYDLVVLGARRRRFFEGMLFGATTLRVVRHSPVAVLTVGEHYAAREATA